MKSIKSKLSLILGIIFLISCSSDDDAMNDVNEGDDNTNDPNIEEVAENFFPLVVGNSWDYENTLSSPSQQDIISNETLSVSTTSEVSGDTVYELNSDNPVGSGPVTLALSQGKLNKSNSSLLYTGEFGLGLNNFPEINFTLENTVIFDTSVSSGTELFSQDETIEQEFQGIPLTIDYTLTTIKGDNFDTYETNGVTYDNVISSQLIVNLEITANITDPLPVSVTIVQSQDAVVVTNFFADGVGLIESETDTAIVFEDITLPIPNLPLDDISFNTLQVLTDYNVTLE
ncbi:hypothetical protein [Flavobacterium sp. CS20]|uniref:hypothetical protein n=1 Tax=Flavobacterium sp. CS20 TaxID=2775246 RepID=UPI001B3A491B|nr:hypothetical protein [Flavobacterium sp. CS20]QTY25941.1 hypothetical protein IGB25_07895 [Flavobacterium sp. CS20]